MLGNKGENNMLNGLPWYAWVVIFVLGVLVFVVLLRLIQMLSEFVKGKNLKTPFLSFEERQKVASESRELLDNQLRTATCYIATIGTKIRRETEKLYPNMTMLEREYLDLLTRSIVDSLLRHYQLDIVRNHIATRTGSDFTDYVESKAEGYYNKVLTSLENFNNPLDSVDFYTVFEKIPIGYFSDLYYKAYISTKKLATSY